jgi:predicted O-linked N-acetylglucosamine transferase (SPINDLY family)
MPTTLRDGDVAMVVDARVRHAAQKLQDGDTEAALAALAPLVADPATSIQARFVTAMGAWRLGQAQAAVGLLQQCHDEAPMEGTIAESLASLYAQVGNLREALFIGKIATALGGHSRLVELMPSDFPSFDWTFVNIKDDPLLGHAKLSLAAGRFQEGLDRVRQHVALYPTARAARLLYASLLLQAGTASQALETLREIEEESDLPAAYQSLYAQALAAIGEGEAAARRHEKAVSGAADDAEIAAARVLDGFWTEASASARTALAKDWAERFCAPSKPATWLRPRGKLVVGYLASAFADPADAAAVAAVARAHDRDGVTVLGYGHGALSWERNAVLGGAFDKWQDIATLDPATLARFIARDGVHVLVDASGFAAPRSLMTLARLKTVLRVGWLGNPGAIVGPVYDARIVPSLPSDERAWHIAGAYPVVATAMPVAERPPGAVAFGADASLAQLDIETVQAWSQTLRATPSATLFLRANDMGPGGNVDRLIRRFGRDLAARIDIVAADQPKTFYPAIDVALAPRRGASPRAAAEALGCGVPVVAFDGEPYGALLRAAGLGDLLVAGDAREYVEIAGSLAIGSRGRERLAAGLASVAGRPTLDADRFAAEIERHALSVLAERAPT